MRPKFVIVIEEQDDGTWTTTRKAVIQHGPHRAEKVIDRYSGATRLEVQGWLIQALASEASRADEAEMEAAEHAALQVE